MHVPPSSPQPGLPWFRPGSGLAWRQVALQCVATCQKVREREPGRASQSEGDRESKRAKERGGRIEAVEGYLEELLDPASVKERAHHEVAVALPVAFQPHGVGWCTEEWQCRVHQPPLSLSPASPQVHRSLRRQTKSRAPVVYVDQQRSLAGRTGRRGARAAPTAGHARGKRHAHSGRPTEVAEARGAPCRSLEVRSSRAKSKPRW